MEPRPHRGNRPFVNAGRRSLNLTARGNRVSYCPLADPGADMSERRAVAGSREKRRREATPAPSRDATWQRPESGS